MSSFFATWRMHAVALPYGTLQGRRRPWCTMRPSHHHARWVHGPWGNGRGDEVGACCTKDGPCPAKSRMARRGLLACAGRLSSSRMTTVPDGALARGFACSGDKYEVMLVEDPDQDPDDLQRQNGQRRIAFQVRGRPYSFDTSKPLTNPNATTNPNLNPKPSK